MVGDVIRRFTATDNDLGPNAALEYTLEQVQPSGETVSQQTQYPTLHVYSL